MTNLTCVCGGIHGEFAKRAFPESKAARAARDAKTLTAAELKVMATTDEFAGDVYDHRAQAVPEHDRSMGPKHKLKCPLWAFAPFSLSPVDLNKMLDVKDPGPWAGHKPAVVPVAFD